MAHPYFIFIMNLHSFFKPVQQAMPPSSPNTGNSLHYPTWDLPDGACTPTLYNYRNPTRIPGKENNYCETFVSPYQAFGS